MQLALILYGLRKSRQNAISSVIYLQIFITVIYLQMLFFCMLFFCRFFCYFCYFFLYVIFLHVIFLQYNPQKISVAGSDGSQALCLLKKCTFLSLPHQCSLKF